MRARLIAILILLILVGGPIWMYWYFISSNTSSFIIETPSDIDFRVDASGKFNYTYLPLADKVIRKSVACQKSCDIGPLPPAIYDIILSASGYETQTLVRSIKRGENLHETVSFHPELKITPAIKDMSGSTLEDEATIETMKSKNANITLHPLIRKVGKLFVEIQDGATRAVGIIKNDVFNKIYELKDLASEGYLDQTKSVYIIPNGSTDTLIFLETREVVVVPHIDTILLARKENTSLILTTKRGSMERVHTEFRGNPRYTDWIDLDTRYRLGYIDASDSTKLSLQNYPPNTGILILLDRSTGVSSILRTPFDMMGFMRLGDGIGFIDKTGQKFTIENIIPGF